MPSLFTSSITPMSASSISADSPGARKVHNFLLRIHANALHHAPTALSTAIAEWSAYCRPPSLLAASVVSERWGNRTVFPLPYDARLADVARLGAAEPRRRRAMRRCGSGVADGAQRRLGGRAASAARVERTEHPSRPAGTSAPRQERSRAPAHLGGRTGSASSRRHASRRRQGLGGRWAERRLGST